MLIKILTLIFFLTNFNANVINDLYPASESPMRIEKGVVFERLTQVSVEKKSREQKQPEVEKTRRVTVAQPVKVKPSRLANYKWASYKGPQDMSWDPYVRAKGKEKKLLGRIALPPKAKWFGAWIPTKDIQRKTREYIVNAQAGNKDTLVQFTIFRMDPWYQESKNRQPTAAEVKDYKRWIRKSARAIGSTRAAIVLQPDLTFLRTVPNFKLSSSLISFAAKQYGALPNAFVYLESGAADWPADGQGGAAEAVRLLEAAGIKYADGIATNTTHYSSTRNEIHRVAAIIKILKNKGYGQSLKGVINTSSNGQPFNFGNYEGPDPDDAWVCRRPNDNRTCVALGIPPTANITAKKYGLDSETRKLARQYVDGYLWIGRPWLKRQNSPFLKDKALTLVKHWEYK